MSQVLDIPPAEATRRRARAWLTGYFGAGNVGDEALLATVLAHAPAGVRAAILGPRQGRDEVHGLRCVQAPPLDAASGRYGLWYGRGYWLRRWPTMLLEPLRRKVCVSPCGGSLNDHVPGRVVRLLQQVRAWRRLGCRRVALLGAGVDHCRSGPDRAAVAELIDEVDYCSVRDAHSAGALRGMGVGAERFHEAADLAFAFAPAKAVREGAGEVAKARIGLNLRPLYVNRREVSGEGDPAGRQEAFLAEAVALVEGLRRMAGEVTLVPFCGQDAKLLATLTERTGVEMDAVTADPHRLLGRVGQFDFFVGMRFHSIVLSLLAGVPCLPLPNATKVLDLGGRLGLDLEDVTIGDGTFLPDRPLRAQAVLEKVAQCWPMRAAMGARGAQVAEQGRLEALADMARCWQTLLEER